MIFRNGMWVVVKNRIGILFQMRETHAEIHYVSEDGIETIEVGDIPYGEIRQATWLEIPKKRRGFTREVATSLGYN